MLSPFPGMDPYLESPVFWSDFHAKFITYWCDALLESLPSNYEARIDEKVNLVQEIVARRKLIEPDVAVTQLESFGFRSTAPAGVATLEPVTMSLVYEEEIHERHIEILYRPDRRLITTLEVLSPANKEEPGRTLCLAKRNALIHQPVHMVELDLLVKGQRLPLEQALPVGDYYALVARWNQRPKCDVYAWSMRQALPAIPIPLLPPDPDVWIDLAAVFTTTYQRARYGRSIDYRAASPMVLVADVWHGSPNVPDSAGPDEARPGAATKLMN